MTKKQNQKNTIMLWHLAVILIAIFMLPITVDAEKPVKPEELSNREAKEHVFKYTPNPDGDGGGYEYCMTKKNTLIMPGDTFTFEVYKSSEEDDDFYYSLGYWNNEKKAYADISYDGEKSDYSFEDGMTEETAVEVTATRKITKKGENAESYEVPVSFKNNSDYPIIIGLNMSGSAGQQGQSYLTRGLTVKFIKPYYNIDYSDSENGKLADAFWPLGEYEQLNFPRYYWITDTPYTISIPNPVREGSHFISWSGICKDYYSNKGDHTEISVCWDPDAEIVNAVNNYFQNYGDVTVVENDKYGPTIAFNGNGGKVNGRDKWVIEVNKDDTDIDNPVYDFNLDYDNIDNTKKNVVASKESDTFLGWCSKEDALYNFNYNGDVSSGSFVTEKDAAAAYEGLSLGESKQSNNWNKGVLYAKWESNTRKTLEEKGFELDEDGVLWLLNTYGVRAWADARKEDSSLPAKVKDINTGFKKDEPIAVSNSGDEGIFEGCTELTELSFSNVNFNDYYTFRNCSNLKSITIEKNDVWNWNSLFGSQQFEGTDIDLCINVPDDKLESLKEYYPEYAYLFNSNTEDKRYQLTVNGEIVSDENLTIACGKGSATFDPKTSTLTLDNAEMSKCMNLHNVSSRYFVEEEGYYNPYNEAVIVSNLPSLRIIIKGTNVVKRTEDYQLRDLVRAYGDVEITGDGSVEGNLVSSHYFIQDDSGESVPYDGICKLPITAFGKVTIDGITAKRLIVNPEKTLDIKNASFEGGQFSSGTGLTLTNVNIEQDKETGGPDSIMETTVGGKSLVVDNSILNYVTVDTDENTQSINFKNSIIQLQGKSNAEVTVSGGDNTSLVIENSTFKAYGKAKGVTNISESKITLAKCAITRGAWKASGYFDIEPVENVPSSGGDDKDTGNTDKGDGKTDANTQTGDKSSGGEKDSAAGNKESGSQDNKTPEVGAIEQDKSGTATYKVTETSKDSSGKTVVQVSYTAPTATESNKTAVNVPNTTTLKDGTIAQVTEIAASAFKNNKKITSVTIGKNVRKIGNKAFYGCKKIKTVNLGSGVTTIGSSAFEKCSALTKITVPKSTTAIGAKAFKGDSKLKLITIKSTKLTSKTLAKNAFKGITSRTTIKVPKSKKKAYTSLFRKKGLSRKVRIK